MSEEGYSGEKNLAHAIATGNATDWTTVAPYLDAAVYQTRLQVLRTAAEQAATIYGAACTSYADDLLTQLDANVVTPIADLYAAAATATTDDDTVESLARAGRSEDAVTLAKALDPAHLDSLKDADRLRVTLLGRLRNDPALPWLPGVTVDGLTPSGVLSAFRSGMRFLDFVDPMSDLDVALVDDDEDDYTGIHPQPINVLPHVPGGIAWSSARDA